MAHLFLAQDQITKLAVPSRQRFRELIVELTSPCAVSSTLACLKVDQQFSDDAFAVPEDLLSVNLRSRIRPLRGTISQVS